MTLAMTLVVTEAQNVAVTSGYVTLAVTSAQTLARGRITGSAAIPGLTIMSATARVEY